MIQGIQDIIDRWYISEPALMKVFFSHKLEANTSMSCPFRCGKGMIEYNPRIVENLNDVQLELFLKAEAIRIILKHPYERQPDGCSTLAKSIGSNLVLADNYDFKEVGYDTPSKYSLPSNGIYEWYSMRVEHMLETQNIAIVLEPTEDLQDDVDVVEQNVGGGTESDVSRQDNDETTESGDANQDDFFVLKLADGTEMRIPKGNMSHIKTQDTQLTTQGNQNRSRSNRKFNNRKAIADLSEMWEEDSVMACAVDSIVEEVQASGKGWGSIPGDIIEIIIANTKAKIDYRKILSGFRASILSSKRCLTRMKPNRRSGFDNMGSIRQFSTNLLVAVDVSGSITNEVLAHFFTVIGRVFKYGIEHIDVVQFDCSLGEVYPLEKAQKQVNICGRGGTDFQIVFDYVCKHREYDGLIIFTDGYAPEPKKPKGMKAKVVWVCENQFSYDTHKEWMKRTGRCCMMQL